MAVPYEVTFSVLDGEGKRGTGTFYIDSQQSVANAITEAEGLLEDIEPLSVGQIESASIRIALDLSGLTQDPPDGQSNRDYKLRWILSSADGFLQVLTIPAGDVTNVSANSENVIRSDPSEGYTLEQSILTRPLVTSHDEAITVVNKAYEVHGR